MGRTSTTYEPRDRTRREHIARVTRTQFVSDARDRCGLALDDGGTAIGPADPDDFDNSTQYRFLGRWKDDPKWGPQFHFTTYVVHQLHGRRGLTKYLTEYCTGIGPKAASKIYDKYGSAGVSTLRENPDAVAAACNLQLELCHCAAAELRRESQFEATRIDLFGIIDGRGFHQGPLIKACIAKWGAKAPQIIRHNPFALLGMPSAGFKRCDALWAFFKKPLDAMKRQVLCAADACKNDGNGHTWLKGTDLAERLRKLISTAEPPEAFKIAKRARLLKFRRDEKGDIWAAVYNRAVAEERIAARVKVLSAHPSLWPVDGVKVSQTDGDKLPTAHQVERLALATTGAVGLFLGGPGSGKTFTLAHLLREVVDRFGKSCVAVCAPTGKAAVRASQALAEAKLGDIAATTIHRLLKIGRNGHDGDGWGFEFNAKSPLHYRFFVVDESSMIDTTLMADLLDAVPPGACVLFVGDDKQLPPVGHGAPLRDMIEAGVPHGMLTEIQRNAGTIVRACQQIKDGVDLTLDPKIDLDAVPPRNLRLIEPRDDAHAAELLTQVLSIVPKYGFDPAWGTQVIVARNKQSAVSRTVLNDLLHPILNPDGYSVGKNHPFRVGDKIICLRNSKMHRMEPTALFHESYADTMGREAGNYQVVMKVQEDDGPPEENTWRELEDPADARRRKAKTAEPDEVYVANGEIGRVVAVGASLAIARFGGDADGEGAALVKIPIGKQGEKEQEEDEGAPEGDEKGDAGKGCQFDLAYAISGHKMQGAESPCVIIMADGQAGGVASREWWYTSISRASKLCVVIGKREVVDKQRMRRSLVRRKTFLVPLLQEAMGATP